MRALVRVSFNRRCLSSSVMDPLLAPYQDESRFEIVREGRVTCVNEKKPGAGKKAAFYNPAQVINRDLSLACIQWHIDQQKQIDPERKLTYLEALSASGLRAIRVAKETTGLSRIVANDLEEVAVKQIERNIELNGLENGKDIEASLSDATAFMYQHRAPESQFDIVDIDPYGTPAIFLDSAVQCVREGGLLQVTATDLQNLCGGAPDVCFRKYGSVPLKSRFCHEMAIRIVLANICLRAQAYNRYIEPIVSLMIDFYVRVFVRVKSGGAEAQQNVTKIGHVWQCPSCHYFETEPMAYKHKTANKFIVSNGTPIPGGVCPFCSSRVKMAGPIWLGPLHHKPSVAELAKIVDAKDEAGEKKNSFASEKKLSGMLSVVMTELPDVPLFYNLSDLCNVLRATSPSMHAFKSAILNAGFRVSGFHTEPYAFKTDAPMSVIWDVLKSWKKKTGLGKQQNENTPAFKIMGMDVEHEADFTLVDAAATDKKRARYIKVDGWGPKTKAVTGSSYTGTKKAKIADDDEEQEKIGEGEGGEKK